MLVSKDRLDYVWISNEGKKWDFSPETKYRKHTKDLKKRLKMKKDSNTFNGSFYSAYHIV